MWCQAGKKDYYAIWGQRRSRSDCADAQSDQDLRCSSIYSAVSSVWFYIRHWPEYRVAQADLGLRSPQMPGDTFFLLVGTNYVDKFHYWCCVNRAGYIMSWHLHALLSYHDRTCNYWHGRNISHVYFNLHTAIFLRSHFQQARDIEIKFWSMIRFQGRQLWQNSFIPRMKMYLL